MADKYLTRIQGDIGQNDVMLYMKGTPMFPQCGFSARVIQILTHSAYRSSRPTCWKTWNCAKASSSSRSGRPCRSFT